MTLAKPFIKWVGGKGQLLEEIRKKYPIHIEKYCIEDIEVDIIKN